MYTGADGPVLKNWKQFKPSKQQKISLLDCFDLHEPSITNALTAIEGVNEERKINFEEMKGKNPEKKNK